MKWIMLLLLGTPIVAQEVTLSLEKYEALRKKAMEKEVDPPAPPTPYALESVEVHMEVNHQRARIVQTFNLMLYEEDWQKIPLPKGSHYVEAQFGDLEGRISSNRGQALHVKGKGRYKIQLTATAMVKPDEEASRPTWRFQWAAPRAALVTGTIQPGADIDHVSVGHNAVLSPETSSEQRGFTARPGATMQITLKAAALADEREDLPLRWQTVTASSTRISRTRLETETMISMRVWQGTLDQVVIPMDPNLEIVSLQGVPAVNWKQEGQNIVVKPVVKVKDKLDLDLNFIAPYAEDVTVPMIIPQGAQKPKIFIGVQVNDDGFVQLEDPGSGRRYSGRALVPHKFTTLKGHVQEVKDPAQPPKWKVFWAEETQVLAAQADKMKVGILAGNNGYASYKVWVNVRNAGVPNLEITMPPGFISTICTRDGEETAPGGSQNRLILPLNTAMDHQLITITGIMPFHFPEKSGQISIPIPALSAPIGTVDLEARFPDNRTYQLQDKHRQGSSGWIPEVVNVQEEDEIFDMAKVYGQQSNFFLPDPKREVVEGPHAFTGINATWTTLSPSPEPLVVKTGLKSSKKKGWL